jgi:glycosyltransferase involved in cell wall biosynthesis
MEKIKIAIPYIQSGNIWIGGINYINNLIEALNCLPDRNIELVILVTRKTILTAKKLYPANNVVDISLLIENKVFIFLSKFFLKVLKKHLILEIILKYFKIDVLTHYVPLGKKCSVKSVCWIPDFQHIHYPDYFSKREIEGRNKYFKDIIDKSTTVILSSYSSKSDLKLFYPDNSCKTSILSFVPVKAFNTKYVSLNFLEDKYEFCGKYFLLPNQFWKHKNHKVVIEAIVELRKRDKNILVICTGNTEDYRDPTFFNEIKALIEFYSITDNFRILGVIPYDHMISLMKYSVAVINPSLFEGWSTSVEEAKCLNKKIVLSNIPVHIEQIPKMSYFFSPTSFLDLANILELLCNEADNFEDEDFDVSISKSKFLEFASSFESILIEAATS